MADNKEKTTDVETPKELTVSASVLIQALLRTRNSIEILKDKEASIEFEKGIGYMFNTLIAHDVKNVELVKLYTSNLPKQ